MFILKDNRYCSYDRSHTLFVNFENFRKKKDEVKFIIFCKIKDLQNSLFYFLSPF